MESAYKSKMQVARGLDPEGMSAIHQSTYSKRFTDFFEQHVDVGEPTKSSDETEEQQNQLEEDEVTGQQQQEQGTETN